MHPKFEVDLEQQQHYTITCSISSELNTLYQLIDFLTVQMAKCISAEFCCREQAMSALL